jgi:hypothetical protein
MIDEQTNLVVGLSESLPEILGRLRKSAGQSVSVEIPAASSLFLTASEFRALHAAAERDRIAVTVSTDDPLRVQLAALFKLAVETPKRTAEQPAANGKPPAPVIPLPVPDEGLADRDESAPRPEDQASPSPVLRRGRLGSRPAGRVTSAPGPDAEIDVGSDLTPNADSNAGLSGVVSQALARARAASRRQHLAAAGALVLIVGLAYLGAYLFLTQATVMLTLRRQPISEDLTIAVSARAPLAGDSAPEGADLALVATPVTFALSTTQTMPTTGIKTVGDAPARGRVNLSNPTGKAVTIEAGTELVDRLSGALYAIEQRVEVPAGEGGAPGFGVAEVRSLEAGSVGNRDQGLLSGRLDNGVYFSNRESAVGGGTDKEIPVVTQADRETLEELARADLLQQGAEQRVEGGLVVLAPSIDLSETSFEFDHRVDEEATAVTVLVNAQVSAFAYAPDELNAQVAAALSAPAGYEVDPTTIRLAEPEIADGGSEVVLVSVRVEGSARAIMTPQERLQIAEAIAGDGESEARDYLGAVPAVDRFEIRYSPGWLPNRIPTSADRVEIDVR